MSSTPQEDKEEKKFWNPSLRAAPIKRKKGERNRLLNEIDSLRKQTEYLMIEKDREKRAYEAKLRLGLIIQGMVCLVAGIIIGVLLI